MKEKMKFIQQANETNTIEGILDLFYFTNYAEGSRMLEGVNAKILKELSEFLGIELKKDSYEPHHSNKYIKGKTLQLRLIEMRCMLLL